MKKGEIGYTIAIIPTSQYSSLYKVKITNLDLNTFEAELLESDYKGWRLTQDKRRFWKTKKAFKQAIQGEK